MSPRSGDIKVFRVNIWDFGGQAIYHSTHQFFLSKRSLYALVADTRRDDTDFYYWLNVVELLSDNSPVLVIKNEKDDRLVELDESALRGRFKNLKDCFSTNLSTCRGLEQVKENMQHFLTHLPHVGSNLPKSWLRVRKELESDPRNFISLQEYLDVCEKHGFKRRDDKLQLADYLHDLGVFLHFQEDDLLMKTVILKPEWGTEAVYNVLDSRKVTRAGGRFSKADLAEIWHDDQYQDMHGELLRLMVNFRLCYVLPGNSQYIVPQLLPKQALSYEWESKENLQLRYAYSFMPEGVLIQIIVAMHPLIEDQGLRVWRHGVVFADGSARAELIENYNNQDIRIRISGKNKRDLLTTVVYELEKIHRTFHRLRVDCLIPCSCEQCRQSQEPHFYPYQRLKKFIADRQDKIQCQKSYVMVEVRRMLDDVIDERRLESLQYKHAGREQGQSPIVNVQIDNRPLLQQVEPQPEQKKEVSLNKHKMIQSYLAFGFGVAFVLAILLIAIFNPSPTPFQYTVFRIVLALFAAGVGTFIPGILNLKIGNVVRASGAMAVFAIVYFYSPATFVTEESRQARPVGSEITTPQVLDSSLPSE